MDKYSDKEFTVLYVPSGNVKINSKLNCTHLNTVSWDALTTIDVKENCIASGATADTQGLWIKISSSIFGENLTEFKTKMEEMSLYGSGITVLYELSEPMFEHVLLNNYKIHIPFGHCFIMPTPSNMVYKVDAIYSDEYRDKLIAESDDGERAENVVYTEPYMVEPNPYLGPYDAELDDGEYWNQVYVTADINTKLIYFYKSLALGL